MSIISIIPILDVEASSNPNLFVSAENSQYENHFAGSMVIEVVVRDNDIRDTDEGKGEPDVTLNGKNLRMVQATDGNWYGYFANVDKALAADSTVVLAGQGLDFGTFCDRGNTTFGISLSDSDGFFVPRSDCNGNPVPDTNNVVRQPKSINTNSGLNGQIGLNPDAWPLIQLFSFSDVIIQYNAAGGAQTVNLEYDDEIPNIFLSLDREFYPQNSEVFVIINDFQLNQDPTDEDSWTFNVASPVTTFYQAFDNNGNESAAGTSGLVNLIPSLSNLGFDENGEFSVDLDSVMELKPNSDQNNITSIDDGSSVFTQIVTFVERGPNSGIFENFDSNDQSTIGITKNAPRGKTGTINYNDNSLSVLTGFSTASVSVPDKELSVGDNSKSLSPGTKHSIILVDSDQNINSSSRDDLDVFRDSSIIPTLKIGDPVTLTTSSNVIFYPDSINFSGGESIFSSVRDKNSARLFLDTTDNSINGTFEQISLNLGVSVSNLQSVLIDTENSDDIGTNWINYDFRSLENDFEINDFSNTRIDLHFNSLSSSPITIISSGDIHSSAGLIQLDANIVDDILEENGSIFVVINFGSSDNLIVSNESNLQPIILDFFSFGLDNQLNGINHSIYRFELEETSDDSSTFEGTFEYAIANQLNILDEEFIKTISPVDDDVKFFITDRLVDEDGIFISYSDLDKVGMTITTSTNSDINTHSGTAFTTSNSYRFGQPVGIVLEDPDLNLRSDRIDTYHVINDPNSPNVDTIGQNGVKLLEILIKDVRYKRCTVDGVEHGGLASTGFSLVETGPSTGVFEGVFKMPSKICNKSGTQLISPAGGSIELRYNDSRDNSGESNIFSSSNNRQTSTSSSHFPQLSATEIQLPMSNSINEIILSGSLDNPRRGVPLSLELIYPDNKRQEFSATVTNSGNYKAVFSINSNSLPGTYVINLEYAGIKIDSVSFNVLSKSIPLWIKDNAKWWSSSSISDSEFVDGIEYLVDENIIQISTNRQNLVSEKIIPNWIKSNSGWWANNLISDEDFVKMLEYLIQKGIIQV
ncbi:MAG: peptidase [Nitrosopumilus sp.]